MTTEVAEMLSAARSLVLKGWTQDYYAVTRSGELVGPKDDRACAWCASGALIAADDGTYDDGMEVNDQAFQSLQEVVGGSGIVAWNDAPGCTQAEVVEAFDKAIERAMS